MEPDEAPIRILARVLAAKPTTPDAAWHKEP